MGDMAEIFNAMREATKKHRAEMLASADTEGWTKHTSYHYSRIFNGERIEWWPSGGKAKYRGSMVYGHRRVNRLIARLKGLTATEPDSERLAITSVDAQIVKRGPISVFEVWHGFNGQAQSFYFCVRFDFSVIASSFTRDSDPYLAQVSWVRENMEWLVAERKRHTGLD